MRQWQRVDPVPHQMCCAVCQVSRVDPIPSSRRCVRSFGAIINTMVCAVTARVWIRSNTKRNEPGTTGFAGAEAAS